MEQRTRLSPRRRSVLAGAVAALCAPCVRAAERWETLPPTPAPVSWLTGGLASVNGVRLYYAQSAPVPGGKPPVVMLHGGLANSNYFGNQVQALHGIRQVLLVDSRGHGRSTRDGRPFGYDLMADDVVALLDARGITRADILGWSDGAILGLDLAMRHPARVGKVFAFGANVTTAGLKPNAGENPNFARFIARARAEYARLSPTPGDFDAFMRQVDTMWESQPNWSADQLRGIHTPVIVADGQYDEGIRLEHTEFIASVIPGAGLLVLPNVSHFAFLQDPALFNAALLDFLSS